MPPRGPQNLCFYQAVWFGSAQFVTHYNRNPKIRFVFPQQTVFLKWKQSLQSRAAGQTSFTFPAVGKQQTRLSTFWEAPAFINWHTVTSPSVSLLPFVSVAPLTQSVQGRTAATLLTGLYKRYNPHEGGMGVRCCSASEPAVEWDSAVMFCWHFMYGTLNWDI